MQLHSRNLLFECVGNMSAQEQMDLKFAPALLYLLDKHNRFASRCCLCMPETPSPNLKENSMLQNTSWFWNVFDVVLIYIFTQSSLTCLCMCNNRKGSWGFEVRNHSNNTYLILTRLWKFPVYNPKAQRILYQHWNITSVMQNRKIIFLLTKFLSEKLKWKKSCSARSLLRWIKRFHLTCIQFIANLYLIKD